MNLRRLSAPSVAFALAVVCWAMACDPSGSKLREWTPADHDQPAPAPSAGPDRAPRTSSGEQPGIPFDEVTAVVWQKSCTACHGPAGKGDGPSPMGSRPRDLSDSAWQATVSDGQLAQSIRNGKGGMPAFQLPDSTIAGLVRLVRFLDPTRRQERTEREAPALDAGRRDPAPAPETQPAAGASASPSSEAQPPAPAL